MNITYGLNKLNYKFKDMNRCLFTCCPWHIVRWYISRLTILLYPISRIDVDTKCRCLKWESFEYTWLIKCDNLSNMQYHNCKLLSLMEAQNSLPFLMKLLGFHFGHRKMAFDEPILHCVSCRRPCQLGYLLSLCKNKNIIDVSIGRIYSEELYKHKHLHISIMIETYFLFGNLTLG